ncbi:MAG TPA: hypothetical protein PLF23_22995, partial [Candidatus Obscuribacter sp.]|nr:hypothetical protein [Candidatus Obscuribacter sp.]
NLYDLATKSGSTADHLARIRFQSIEEKSHLKLEPRPRQSRPQANETTACQRPDHPKEDNALAIERVVQP